MLLIVHNSSCTIDTITNNDDITVEMTVTTMEIKNSTELMKLMLEVARVKSDISVTECVLAINAIANHDITSYKVKGSNVTMNDSVGIMPSSVYNIDGVNIAVANPQYISPVSNVLNVFQNTFYLVNVDTYPILDTDNWNSMMLQD